MNVFIEFEKEYRPDFDLPKVAESVFKETMNFEKMPYECNVEIVFTGDDEIREVNKETRKLDQSTDVLSFPMIPFSRPGDYQVIRDNEIQYTDPETSEIFLGDMMLSVDHIREQAKKYGHSEKRETAFLITHSLLHLLGYDHMEDRDAEIMEEHQRQILQKLQILREEEKANEKQ